MPLASTLTCMFPTAVRSPLAEDTDVTGQVTEAITDNVIVNWLKDNATKIIFFIVALAVAWAVDRVLTKALRRVLDRSQIPSASIFVNCGRVGVWVIWLLVVLKPVFGVEPTTLITALGVGGIALSFGLKDTISNLIGGFGLMMSKVVQPGDLITVSGYSGVVKDVTWRNTIVESRDGNEFWIPNSVLNTAGLTKMTTANEAIVKVPFTARGDVNVATTAMALAKAVDEATGDLQLENHPCLVRFTGFSAYGAEGNVIVYAKSGLLTSTVADRAARAMVGLGCLVADGAASVSVPKPAAGDGGADSGPGAASGAGATAAEKDAES